MLSLSKHEASIFALRQACPERRSSFDKLRMTGVEGLRANGTKPFGGVPSAAAALGCLVVSLSNHEPTVLKRSLESSMEYRLLIMMVFESR